MSNIKETPDFYKQIAEKFHKDITIKRILDLKASILKNSIPTFIVDKETKEAVRVYDDETTNWLNRIDSELKEYISVYYPSLKIPL